MTDALSLNELFRASTAACTRARRWPR